MKTRQKKLNWTWTYLAKADEDLGNGIPFHSTAIEVETDLVQFDLFEAVLFPFIGGVTDILRDFVRLEIAVGFRQLVSGFVDKPPHFDQGLCEYHFPVVAAFQVG